jgi:hypothetical protein
MRSWSALIGVVSLGLFQVALHLPKTLGFRFVRLALLEVLRDDCVLIGFGFIVVFVRHGRYLEWMMLQEPPHKKLNRTWSA